MRQIRNRSGAATGQITTTDAAVRQASPPRLTQLPAMRRCHMPYASSHAVSPHASIARPHVPHHASHSSPRYAGATGLTRRCMADRHASRPHARPPPRLTQLPAIRRCHMPRASAHAVSPHASTACSRLSTAPHTATRDTPVAHVSRVGARRSATRPDRTYTPLHRASHSYPRYVGATRRTLRCMAYRHASRPHSHISASHAHTRITTRCGCATGAARPAVRVRTAVAPHALQLPRN